MSKPQTLQTVERALTFLEFVASVARPPTVQQVAAALELNITTSYHLMRTLLGRGYLARRDDATLVLGSRVGTLFRAYRASFSIDVGLSGLVDRLAAQTGETSFLSVLQDNRVLLKVLVEASQTLRVTGLFVGLSGNEHRRASGKAVLAFADAAQRKAILATTLGNEAPRDRKAIVAELEPVLDDIRSRGWSLDDAQTRDGIAGLCAPVFDAQGRIYGAIGIVTPTLRMDRSQAEYLGAVRTIADEATAMMGTDEAP